MNLFCFGLGYSALASLAALREQMPQIRLSGTVRTPEKAEHLRAQGINAHLFDDPSPALHADLAAATHVLASIAPDEAGDPVLLHHAASLDAARDLQWLGYYSTVGVYGDFGGAWIDETAPLTPRNARSQWRVEAEQAWRDYAQSRALPLAILRLAGIYGPGRSPLTKLLDGTAHRIVKPGQVFNRIHVADIAQATALAALRRLDGTYNVSDDEPAPPQDVVTYAATLLGVTPPPEIPYASADMTPMARSFYADNKRISNAALKQALGLTLLYPTYRDGLASLSEPRS